MKSGISAAAAERVLASPQLVVVLLKEFGNVLYSEGAALYIYRHLAVYAQKNVFGIRPCMNVVWDNVHRWEILEPTVHRVPLPTSVFRALVTLSVLWGWHKFAGSLCLAFYGITRPGEVLRATRKHLVLPEKLCLQLGIERKHRLTPASVRGGGALAEYRAGTDLQRILWRMRIRHIITLEHYVQEVAGESFIAELSSESRRKISLLSGLFKSTLLAFERLR